jgi:FixJ family two-component response regulator
MSKLSSQSAQQPQKLLPTNLPPCLSSERPKNIEHSGDIFVVDDDASIRDILTLILSLEGFPVTTFADGETFLKRAHEKIPICVFLDIFLPKQSGFHILRELNALQFKAPVFLISARDDTSIVVEGIKIGAHDFLRKPFDPYSAVQRVRDAIEVWNTRNHVPNRSESEAWKFPDGVRLTRREAEVLAEVTRGESSKEIAKSLGIKKRTVDHFRESILTKFGAKNTVDLMRMLTR